MLHEPAEVAAFLDGETRLVAAAWREDSTRPPFVLPENQAVEHRHLAKSDLRCVFQNCPSPDLTTVHRTRSRDGFRHLTNSDGHGGPESFHHVQGKVVVAQWLRDIAVHPGTRVEVEHGIDTQRTRVSDVALVSADGLHRVAFEIQYAPITPDAWMARHRDYEAAGIVDVWLFGHTRLRLARGKRTTPRFAIAPVHEAVIRTGQPLLFLNPELGRLAIGVERSIHTSELMLATDHPFGVSTIEVLTLDLGDARVNRGIVAAEIDLLRAASARHAESAAAVGAANARQNAAIMAGWTARQPPPRRQSWLEKKRQSERVAREREAATERKRQALEVARPAKEADRRERHLARGKTVLCTRCWYPLEAAHARAGQHPDCPPPAERQSSRVARTLLGDG